METKLEQILMTVYKEQMIVFMHDHPECFDEAVQLALGDKQPYSWRAAWLICSCIEENDLRITPYIDSIIESARIKKGGHKRELVKILLFMDLNDDQEGYLFDICVDTWENIRQQPSIRYMAFRFIMKTCKKHKELISEIEYLTQNHYLESLSPGVKHSVRKMINELEKGR